MNNSISTDITAHNSQKHLSLNDSNNIKAEKKRLYKTAKDMESLFMYQILRAMRKTIPKTNENGKMGMGGGMGKDIYSQIFDQELSVMMSGNNNKSIADVIYRSMEKALERQYGVENKGPSKIKDIFPVKKYIKIKNDNPGLTTGRVEKAKSADKTDRISKYDYIIRQAAKKYRLHPSLIRSVIKVESNGNPLAISKAGAKGLMQLADTTASDMGVTDVFDPGKNIEGGARYLRLMIDRFDDIKNALAAYNAGPETVKRYEGIPPFPETQRYVKTVLDNARVEKPYY